MRFFEFKTLIKKNKLTEDAPDPSALPSSLMAKGNLFTRGTTKYVTSIADSINSGKIFAFKRGKDKDAAIGKVSDIIVDGKSLTADAWESWASNPEVDKDSVMSTKFVVGNEEFTPNQMYKTEAVAGLSINKGDLAEVILGAALTAKYFRGGSTITSTDVVNFMKEVVSNQKVTVETNYKESGIKEDQIEFYLTLNAASMAGIKAWLQEPDPMSSAVNDFKIVTDRGIDAKLVKDIQNLVKDGTTYANNSKQVDTAVNKAKADPNHNLVEIISDGGDASQQSITKVDLKVMFDGTPTRLLSLKSGTVGQFGQESGASWDAVTRFVNSTLRVDLPDNLKDEWGFKDRSDPDYLVHNFKGGPFAKLYSYIEKRIKEYTAGDNTVKEYNLVKIVYDAINYHATKGEEGVTMVILSPTAKIAYKELAFDTRLLKALELYDLQVINYPGKANHQLVVYGSLIGDQASELLGDKKAAKLSGKSKLFQLRSAVQGGAIRNVIEMGELLKDLANIEKLEKQDPAAEPSTTKSQPKQQAKPQVAPQQGGAMDDAEDKRTF